MNVVATLRTLVEQLTPEERRRYIAGHKTAIAVLDGKMSVDLGAGLPPLHLPGGLLLQQLERQKIRNFLSLALAVGEGDALEVERLEPLLDPAINVARMLRAELAALAADPAVGQA